MKWFQVGKTDVRARLLADRHYSRQSVGHHEFCPPGNSIVLIIPNGVAAAALWVSHRPDPNAGVGRADGFDYWDNPYFRNESDYLSSELIVEALQVTRYLWRDKLPSDGFHSFVNSRKVQSRNPGYCFKCAGFEKHPERTKVRNLIRFIYPLEKLLALKPSAPNYEQLRLFA